MNQFPDMPKKNPSSRRRHGSAIVIVLLLIFLLTVSVISFFLLVQDDRQRARSFLDVIRAQIMIESATQEAMAKIMDGSEVKYTTSGVGNGETYRAQANMTAEPGLMEVRYYDEVPNRGYETNSMAFTSTNAFFQNPFNNQYQTAANTWAQANPQLIPLFSWKWYAPGIRYLKINGGSGSLDISSTNANYNPAVSFNINTSANPFYPGELYLSGIPAPTVAAKAAYNAGTPAQTSLFLPNGTNPGFQFQTGESSLDRPIFVQWIPIYENPALPPGPKNKVIGRYAYWVDVENTKVNLNTSRRLFDDSAVRAMEGKSQAELTGSGYYFQLAPTLSVQSPGQGNPSSGTQLRDAAESSLWKSDAGGAEIEQDGATNAGDNSAAVNYFNLWFGWNSSTNTEQNVPYAADNSMVDWRVFTGMRPYGLNGQGTNVSVEQLTTSYGVNIANTQYGAFNTWLESYSLLDPAVQESNFSLGQLTMATMRRTHALSTTIYGYEDELDPLGRPKLDIVTFQNQPLGGAVYAELKNRLNDPNYHSAYYPKAFPAGGTNLSFSQSFNGFAGDLSATNSLNGDTVVNQMLVNIYSYGQPHSASPAAMMTQLAGNGYTNTNGVWPAKSMPYVAEVATRARSAMMLLSVADRNNLGNFFTSVVTNVAGVPTTNWNSVTNIAGSAATLTGTDGVARPNFWYLTNVLVDVGVGFVNPNPFATNSNVTTMVLNAEGGSFWNTNVIVKDLNYSGGIGFSSSGTDTIQGTYALRPAPASIGGFGLRANGSNCYFNMGVVPSSVLTNTNVNYGTALRIKGWTLTDGINTFDQVPMPNLGQDPTVTPVRSWWQMALTGNNAGPIYNMTSLAWFRTGSIVQSSLNTNYYYPTFAPPYVDRAVGWFTPKTICEITNAVTNAIFPGLIFPLANFPAGTTNLPYGSNVANMTNIPDSVFRTNWSWFQALTNQAVNCTNAALVERIQCVDPVIGHRTGNPANLVPVSSANTAYTYLDTASTPAKYQIQAAAPGVTALAGHFYGVAGHPWRLYDNYATSTATNVVGGIPNTMPQTTTNTVTVTVPQGVGFVTETVNQVSTIQVPSGGSGPATTNVSLIGPASCLTQPFNNPNTTRFSQTEWDGSYIAQYGGFFSYNQAGQNGEASMMWTTNNGAQWPADLESGSMSYAGPPSTTQGGQGWYLDSRGSATGIRGSGNAGSTAPSASYSTPWGILDSAPRGQPMTSIGELGFVHSGFMQHPINIGGVQYLKQANYGGAPTSVLGSPENGPPMSMLLDLFTPHPFRDNLTGVPYGSPPSQSAWASSPIQNTPDNPRRGTVNVNEAIASDYYMAIREGYSTSGAVRADPTSMAIRPAWVPSAMFFRNSTLNTAEESNLNNQTADGGKLDSFMQPVPRYRRGWDSVISMIGGDFSPNRELGEGAWLGRGTTVTDAGVGYMAIGAPLGTWKTGLPLVQSPTGSVFALFDTSSYFGGASELLTLGREVTQNSNSNTHGYFTGHFAADGVSFDTSGVNNITTFLSSTGNNDAKGNLWEATRFAITPLRHFVSEIPYDTTGQRDIYTMNSARMPVTPDVGSIHTALNMGPPSATGNNPPLMPPFPTYGASSTANGSAGIMQQMGIYSNAFMEQAANMASTSANAFTIHVVAQAIKNTGTVRMSGTMQDVGNSGPGYMNTDDQVLAEQWAQIVVERVPQTASTGDLSRDTNGAPINNYRILYYRILDNAK
ncbi:MAG: hypothetical protein WCD79_18975 [Chthoniobacteraceae bacterium]